MPYMETMGPGREGSGSPDRNGAIKTLKPTSSDVRKQLLAGGAGIQKENSAVDFENGGSPMIDK